MKLERFVGAAPSRSPAVFKAIVNRGWKPLLVKTEKCVLIKNG